MLWHSAFWSLSIRTQRWLKIKHGRNKRTRQRSPNHLVKEITRQVGSYRACNSHIESRWTRILQIFRRQTINQIPTPLFQPINRTVLVFSTSNMHLMWSVGENEKCLYPDCRAEPLVKLQVGQASDSEGLWSPFPIVELGYEASSPINTFNNALAFVLSSEHIITSISINVSNVSQFGRLTRMFNDWSAVYNTYMLIFIIRTTFVLLDFYTC